VVVLTEQEKGSETGLICPLCGFRGAMLYVETCWECGGRLVYCPRCVRVVCQGSWLRSIDGDLRRLMKRS
jgi:hypothetical protein